MKNRKQAERTVIGMGQNLRLNCTAHLMQRLLLTAFFILAVSALAVGISQGERYLQAFTLALLAGITRSFGDMPMRLRSAQRYTAGGIWPCFPIFSDMPIF